MTGSASADAAGAASAAVRAAGGTEEEAVVAGATAGAAVAASAITSLASSAGLLTATVRVNTTAVSTSVVDATAAAAAAVALRSTATALATTIADALTANLNLIAAAAEAGVVVPPAVATGALDAVGAVTASISAAVVAASADGRAPCTACAAGADAIAAAVALASPLSPASATTALNALGALGVAVAATTVGGVSAVSAASGGNPGIGLRSGMGEGGAAVALNIVAEITAAAAPVDAGPNTVWSITSVPVMNTTANGFCGAGVVATAIRLPAAGKGGTGTPNSLPLVGALPPCSPPGSREVQLPASVVNAQLPPTLTFSPAALAALGGADVSITQWGVSPFNETAGHATTLFAAPNATNGLGRRAADATSASLEFTGALPLSDSARRDKLPGRPLDSRVVTVSASAGGGGAAVTTPVSLSVIIPLRDLSVADWNAATGSSPGVSIGQENITRRSFALTCPSSVAQVLSGRTNATVFDPQTKQTLSGSVRLMNATSLNFDGTVSSVFVPGGGISAGLANVVGGNPNAAGGDGGGALAAAPPVDSTVQSDWTFYYAADCGAGFGDRAFVCGPGTGGLKVTYSCPLLTTKPECLVWREGSKTASGVGSWSGSAGCAVASVDATSVTCECSTANVNVAVRFAAIEAVGATSFAAKVPILITTPLASSRGYWAAFLFVIVLTTFLCAIGAYEDANAAKRFAAAVEETGEWKTIVARARAAADAAALRPARKARDDDESDEASDSGGGEDDEGDVRGGHESGFDDDDGDDARVVHALRAPRPRGARVAPAPSPSSKSAAPADVPLDLLASKVVALTGKGGRTRSAKVAPVNIFGPPSPSASRIVVPSPVTGNGKSGKRGGARTGRGARTGGGAATQDSLVTELVKVSAPLGLAPTFLTALGDVRAGDALPAGRVIAARVVASLVKPDWHAAATAAANAVVPSEEKKKKKLVSALVTSSFALVITRWLSRHPLVSFVVSFDPRAPRALRIMSIAFAALGSWVAAGFAYLLWAQSGPGTRALGGGIIELPSLDGAPAAALYFFAGAAAAALWLLADTAIRFIAPERYPVIAAEVAHRARVQAVLDRLSNVHLREALLGATAAARAVIGLPGVTPTPMPAREARPKMIDTAFSRAILARDRVMVGLSDVEMEAREAVPFDVPASVADAARAELARVCFEEDAHLNDAARDANGRLTSIDGLLGLMGPHVIAGSVLFLATVWAALTVAVFGLWRGPAASAALAQAVVGGWGLALCVILPAIDFAVISAQTVASVRRLALSRAVMISADEGAVVFPGPVSAALDVTLLAAAAAARAPHTPLAVALASTKSEALLAASMLFSAHAHAGVSAWLQARARDEAALLILITLTARAKVGGALALATVEAEQVAVLAKNTSSAAALSDDDGPSGRPALFIPVQRGRLSPDSDPTPALLSGAAAAAAAAAAATTTQTSLLARPTDRSSSLTSKTVRFGNAVLSIPQLHTAEGDALSLHTAAAAVAAVRPTPAPRVSVTRPILGAGAFSNVAGKGLNIGGPAARLARIGAASILTSRAAVDRKSVV